MHIHTYVKKKVLQFSNVVGSVCCSIVRARRMGIIKKLYISLMLQNGTKKTTKKKKREKKQ